MADSGRYRFYQSLLSLGGFSGCRLKARSCKIHGELGLTSPPSTSVENQRAGVDGSWIRTWRRRWVPRGSGGCSTLVEIWLKVWEETWHLPEAAKRLLLFHYGFLHPSGFSLFHKMKKKRLPALLFGPRN